MRRIAPRETVPEHTVEIGYLTDLTIAIKRIVYALPDSPYLPTLDSDLLAAWSLVHRANLAQCGDQYMPYRRAYGGELSLVLGEFRRTHAVEVARIDALIDKLKRGLAEGDVVKYVTTGDIEQLERDYRALGDCQRKVVWY